MMEEIKPKKERKFLKAMGDIALTLFRELVLGIGKKVINKVGNKRQGLVISFVILASTFAIAQFPNTGNKQRLGFQTTADGLVWRGALSDTASIQPINNQSAWVILDTINLKFYTFDFTSNVWNLVGGGGAAFTQPVDSLFFNTGVPTNNVDTAKMRWDSDLATVVLGLNDNVPNELGFKNFWLVKNQTGSTITKGSLVYANGTVGASGRITVAKFIANGSIDAKYLLGITAHDLTDGEDGYVISFGKIRQVNTDTFAAGAILYPSPTVAGVWTDVEPVAPNIDMPIGFCINSSVNNGTIAIRVASGYKLSELHDVSITSPVEKSSLYYSGGLWRDTTAALLVSDTASMLIPYLRKLDTITLSNRINTKLNISDTASMLLPYLRDADTVTLSNRINLKLNISDTSAFARDNQISGTSGQVAYFNSSSSVVSDTALRWSAANKSLGINMTTVPSGANLIIKNSQEPVRSTVVATQTFAADTTNWTRGAGWTFNGTQAVATAATGDLTYTPALTITSGNAYEITYTLSNYTAGTLTARFGNATAVTLPTHNVTNNIVVLLPTAATGGFRFNTSTFTGNLDNVSVVQIANPSPILFAGQDDNSTTLYNALRMPNSSTITFSNTAGIYTTGLDNVFIGRATANNNTTGNSNVFIGSGIGNRNTSGSYNVFIGSGIGAYNTTGGGNTFIGSNVGASNTTGNYNTFLGLNVGINNTTGTNNSFFGSSSGSDNTIGNSNTFFGFQSGFNNTGGSNNTFIGGTAGRSNTTGSANTFFGAQAGENSLTGSINVFIGYQAGRNNTSGSTNVFIGREAGLNNRAGAENVSIGTLAGRNIKGNYNVSLGYQAGDNSVIADTTTGSNNILIGFTSGNNIAAAAAGNVAIGNAVDLPTNNGSNQGVYQNVLFFTGASGTGTMIAAASKAGIKTNAPNRDLEVAGEVRITDLTTDTPTRLVGADADGDLGQVTLGAGLSLASSSLLADTSFLVTRFDTASMLTPYFRDADTVTLSNRINAKLNISDTANMLVPYLRKADTTSMLLPYFRDADTTSLNLTSRFATKLNISDTASMLTNYLRSGTAASTYLTQSNAASTYLPLTGGTLTGTINRQEGSHNGSTSTFYYNILNYFARQDNIKYNPTAQITFTDRPGTLTFPNNVRTSDIHLMTARSFNGTSLGQYLDTTLSVVANQDGGRIGISKLNPNYKLDVNGTFNASGNSLIGGTLEVTGATTITGNVGIGINSSTEKLHIFNNAGINPSSTITKIETSGSTLGYAAELRLINNNTSGRTYAFTSSGPGDSFVGSSNLGIVDYTANAVRLLINSSGNIGIGTITPNAKLEVHGSAVFNEGAADADFRVESIGNNNMVFVDASMDRVGIGTNSPTKTLDVNGELKVLSAGTFGGRLETNWLERTYSNSTSTSLTVSVNTTWLKLENNSTITLTLPNAATYSGKELHIKNAGTGAVNSLSSNIEPLNSTTIGTAILASGGGKWATLVSDGTYWVIMAGN